MSKKTLPVAERAKRAIQETVQGGIGIALLYVDELIEPTQYIVLVSNQEWIDTSDTLLLLELDAVPYEDEVDDAWVVDNRSRVINSIDIGEGQSTDPLNLITDTASMMCSVISFLEKGEQNE